MCPSPSISNEFLHSHTVREFPPSDSCSNRVSLREESARIEAVQGAEGASPTQRRPHLESR